jgi:hypothetical protein
LVGCFPLFTSCCKVNSDHLLYKSISYVLLVHQSPSTLCVGGRSVLVSSVFRVLRVLERWL